MPAIVAVLAIAWGVYVGNYYHSDEEATALLAGTSEVSVTQIKNGLFLDGNGKEDALIFYPGGKVEYTAYLPLLVELASQGVDCFLLKMPCNLAIFGSNRAQAVMDNYDYEHWYLAGHSLGGAMAASYAAGHLEELDGLVLLAAYPTKSLAADDFCVLTLYGSEDGVLAMDKVEAGRAFMPADYTELCIQGGNHAQFGSYGAQDGDGTATISAEEQRGQTVEAIVEMIKGRNQNN